jgi:hypothetical protein
MRVVPGQGLQSSLPIHLSRALAIALNTRANIANIIMTKLTALQAYALKGPEVQRIAVKSALNDIAAEVGAALPMLA